MAWTARWTGPQTIGVRRAALEYHTRTGTTVNVAFKGPMKPSGLLGIAHETLRYGPPRPANPTP
jgi:hypothetical protein